MVYVKSFSNEFPAFASESAGKVAIKQHSHQCLTNGGPIPGFDENTSDTVDHRFRNTTAADGNHRPLHGAGFKRSHAQRFTTRGNHDHICQT
jgi:hypothetical protein